jgi:hypothetical protein
VKQTQRSCLAVLALFLGVSVVASDETKDRGKSDPPGVPVEARLEARQGSYTLDLGGKTGEEFRKQVRAGDTTRAYPPAAQVDLMLHLRNNSEKPVDLRIGGTTTVVLLDLVGTGALSVPLKGQITSKIAIAPRVVTLKAGQSETIPIRSLSYGFKGSHRAYWTEPGEYTLTASYKTSVSPAPKGSTDAGNGFGTVTITSAPIKIKVMAKE